MLRLAAWCFAFAALAAAAIAVGWPRLQEHLHQSYLAEPLGLAEPVILDIAPGSPLSTIASAAAQAGVVADAGRFAEAAAREGKERSLRAGRYRIGTDATVGSLLEQLADGDVITERFTIIEGQTAAVVLAALGQDDRLRGQLPADAASELLELPAEAAGSIEGMLFPDTYLFDSGSAATVLLARANQRMMDNLQQAWLKRAPDLPYATPYEALIMASIIEKETGSAGEREVIASVFTNRMRRKMRLQSDPTVIYGLGSAFDGNLTKAHLRADTPFNTYTRAGLPPTPIALPGRAAIEAALHPAETKYLYFVADGSGGHVFSRTLREHNNAVNRYQRRRNAN